MRRPFTTSFIVLALVVGAAGVAPAAHAQTANGGSCFVNADCASNYCSPQGSPDEFLCKANAAASSGNTYAPDTASANTPADFKLGTEFAFTGVMSYVAQLFAWLLGVAVITLDNTVYYTVVTMGTFINNLSAVGVTWSILRDLGNIIIIFGFLAIGITTILNVNWYGGKMKMLPMLLVSAVFLNFSLFITEAVIDTGNLFATQFYTQINGGDPAGAKELDPSSINREGISNKIMSSLGLQTIYGEAQDPKKAKVLFDNYWTIGFMSVILFIIAAFVMFSLAFILIARFVILLFLIIISPVAFAGLAIPQLASMAKKWWSTLFEQTITAPVLLLLLYVALAVITDVQFLTGFSDCVAGSTADGGCSNPSYVGFTNGNFNSFASVILSFLVAMGLLLAVTIFSKKLSAFGGSWATKTAGKLTFGATAWAGRTSGGWLAQKGANKARKTWVGRVPLAGTGLVKGLDRIAGASFDVRGSEAFKNIPFGGVDAGAAQKGGYKADLKGRVESRTKYASELKGRELTVDEKVQQTLLQNEIKAQQRKRARSTSATDINVANTAIKTAQDELDKIESVTDKGAQRKYASVLEFGQKPEGVFNKYFNLAANTEAAKKFARKQKIF